MRKTFICLVCAVLIIVGALASILRPPGYSVQTVVASGVRLLTLRDVVAALTAGSFVLEASADHATTAPELGGLFPLVFRIRNYDGKLYIYIFPSIEACRKVSTDTDARQASIPYGMGTFFQARNVLIVYVQPAAGSEQQYRDQDQRLECLNDIVIMKLNNGKRLTFQGESDHWRIALLYEYYEYWWQDSNGRMQYASWYTARPSFLYKRLSQHDTVANVVFDYAFKSAMAGFGGRKTIGQAGDSNGGMGYFSGNGALIRAGATVEATIKWNGREESCSLSS